MPVEKEVKEVKDEEDISSASSRRSRATEWIKRLLCTVIERESCLKKRAAGWRSYVCVCVCMWGFHQNTYNTFIYHAIASLPGNTEMRERGCYVRDVLDRKCDCEGAGERWKGEKKRDIKWPGMKSHVKTGVEVKRAVCCDCGGEHDWEIENVNDRVRPRNWIYIWRRMESARCLTRK